MKSINQMFTHISPFNTCSEVLEAAKQVAFETKYIRSMTGLQAWEQSHLDIINIVRPAIRSNTFTGQDLDDLERAYSILNHAITIKVPQIIETLENKNSGGFTMNNNNNNILVNMVKEEYDCVIESFRVYPSAVQLFENERDNLSIYANETNGTHLGEEDNVFTVNGLWIYADYWYDVEWDD